MSCFERLLFCHINSKFSGESKFVFKISPHIPARISVNDMRRADEESIQRYKECLKTEEDAVLAS